MPELDYNPSEELARLETIKELFEHDGWQNFLQDMALNLQAVQSCKGITGEQELGFRQGQVQVLEGVLNYESLIEATEAQITEDINAELETDA